MITVYSNYHHLPGEVIDEDWENRVENPNNGYIKVEFDDFTQEVPYVYLTELKDIPVKFEEIQPNEFIEI